MTKQDIEAVKKMRIKKVVRNAEWQELRKSFLKTWATKQVENVEKLRKYLGDFSDPLKIRRVLNYITGTGFRLGKISHPEITKLHNDIKEVWTQ